MSKYSNKICPRCGKSEYVNYIGQSNTYEAKCYNCGYYFAFGELDLYEEKKPMTNADRIRAMTDEELADWFSIYCCRNKTYDAHCDEFGNCKACWADWLQEEVEE